MGLGTLLSQESQPYDPEAYRLLGLAQRSLSAGRFVVVNTMTSLQALVRPVSPHSCGNCNDSRV
jgi:hypothetical protein